MTQKFVQKKVILNDFTERLNETRQRWSRLEHSFIIKSLSDKEGSDFAKMGLCKLFGYVLIAVIAILAYFQMQCWQEDQEKAKVPRTKFNPKETNCQIEYGFPLEDSGKMIEIGIIYIFTQSMPCALLKAVSYLQGEHNIQSNSKFNLHIFYVLINKTVDFTEFYR